MENQKPQCNGNIYTNDFKNAEKQPDWTGEIEFTKELMQDLVSTIKDGQPVMIRVALWDRISKNNKKYKYARFEQGKQKQEAPVENTSVASASEDIPF
tara:strand:+ start:365 stop:658 length:294 start_codon:yes stop_codon:yes gene_type:complete